MATYAEYMRETADWLRNELVKRNLPTDGLKDALAQRLADDDNDPDVIPDEVKPADQADVPSLAEKAAELPEEAKTGAMKRNEALDAMRAAERADVESGGDSEMKRWHEQYSPRSEEEEV